MSFITCTFIRNLIKSWFSILSSHKHNLIGGNGDSKANSMPLSYQATSVVTYKNRLWVIYIQARPNLSCMVSASFDRRNPILTKLVYGGYMGACGFLWVQKVNIYIGVIPDIKVFSHSHSQPVVRIYPNLGCPLSFIRGQF